MGTAMLVCRACNTRYADSKRACPSCGRRSSSNATEAASGDSGPLPPGRAVPPPDEIDLELDESSVLDSTGDGLSGASSASRSSSGSTGVRKPATQARPVPPKPAPGGAGGALGRIEADAEQVKALLAEQPGLLEKGLGLHADEDGELVGLDFATPVGSIDLLARDRKGGFVVVHIPTSDEVGDSVSAMLRRMGWVRKHLAEGGEEVRGVVVLDRLPEDLAYEAAGAGGALSFKGYQLSLAFHDLD